MTASERSAAVRALAAFLHMSTSICMDRATPLAAEGLDRALAAAALEHEPADSCTVEAA